MTKTELVDQIADEVGSTKREAREHLDAALGIIKESLRQGEDVKLVGFAKFYLYHAKAHTARNPRTGETVEVPAKTKARCKMSPTVMGN